MTDRLHQLGLVPFFTRQLSDPEFIQTRLGRVMAVQRAESIVGTARGELSVGLSPALQQADAIDRPTVGDWVVLDEALTRMEQVLERKSLFRRLGAGTNAVLQPIAANIDILFIVSSCNEEFKESRLERYLALCAEAGAMPVIVLTKADLADDADAWIQRARRVQPGVPVEIVNALDADSLAGLRAWLDKSATAALVGSSGVGKSTLLNTLAGNARAETGSIREQDKKGRHTTTHRELHILPSGGLLIDVPGMRELRVADIEDALDSVFDDIAQLAMQCRFADCGHKGEPGCAVQRAIEENNLDERRLANYQKLLRENAHASATLAEKRSQGREFAKLVKQVKQIKKNKGSPD